MEFRDTLLAAQRNQQQKSSDNARLYKARFDPPKKEKVDRPKDRLSLNIQKFLAKKEEEEKQKQLEAVRKRDELMSKRDTKAMNKIRKSLKVFKSANKSVLSDAIDVDNTAITLEGPHQPDQDDYGYESQEAAAIYQKMMEKYSKLPEESKFPINNRQGTKKDIENTKERVRYALQHKDDPVPHKRRRKTDIGEGQQKEPSPPTKSESEKKIEKPKIRKPMPPPMDFNQLLKLAEMKKAEPVDVASTKNKPPENELERPMTKKQRKEYEEEMARKQRRQQRLEQQAAGRKGPNNEVKQSPQIEKKTESVNRIPKLSDRLPGGKTNKPSSILQRHLDRDRFENTKETSDNTKQRLDNTKERLDHTKERLNNTRERLEKLKNNKSEKEIKIDKDKFYDKERNASREKIDNMKIKQNTDPRNNLKSRPEHKSNIELKNQNTYRIDKNSNEKKVSIPNRNADSKHMNGHNAQQRLGLKQMTSKSDVKDKGVVSKQKVLFGANNSHKPNGVAKDELRRNVPAPTNKNVPAPTNKNVPSKRPDERASNVPSSSKSKITNSFDFDKHMSSIGKAKKPVTSKKPDDSRRKTAQKRRILDSEEEDSEMDDFIDDGDEEEDYSKHIKEIFGYDKSRYRDDDDDPDMESSFARQMREEYISKKIGIMEDLEDMKMEAEEKKRKAKRK